MKEDMTITEKALTAILKDIDTAFYTISAGLASGPPREYSIAKINYFYSKAEEDIEE